MMAIPAQGSSALISTPAPIPAVALEKKRPVTRRHPAIGVPGRVADVISLGLDDMAADNAFVRLAQQELADQVTRERDRIDRQFGAGERGMTARIAARCQPIGSTHCAREAPGANGSAKYCVSRATFPSVNSMMLTV